MAAYNFNDYYIYFLLYPKYGTITFLDRLDYNQRSYKRFLTILQYAYNYYKLKDGEQPQMRKKLLVCTYWPCHNQPKDSVLYGYYIYEFLRVNERYLNTEDLPRINHKTSFDDEGIKNVKQHLCHFVLHECCHQDKLFFDPEGSLATSGEYKSLRD